jgi:predicted PurR-regulated permease PerM
MSRSVPGPGPARSADGIGARATGQLAAAGAPAWAVRTLAVCAAALAVAAVAWLVFWLLLRLPLLTITLVVALLLTALVSPVNRRLRAVGAPRWLAALVPVLLLLAVLTGIALLFGLRATARLQDLTRPLGAALDRIRVWLVEGPLGLEPGQVVDLRNQAVTWLYQLTPSPAAGARTALYALSTLILVLFLVFFLLKDGAAMWRWVLTRVPERRRDRVDGAGAAAWATLTSYTGGVVVVALIDAIGIGAALLVLGVPLWVSLTLLTFLGAFVPVIGATVSGAVAVLVTMVTNDVADAIVVLVVVVVVQQVEGNLLQPLIMSRAVRLHPAVVLVAVTGGFLLYGIPGALFATPAVAVAYRVVEHLRTHPEQSPPAPGTVEPPSADAGGRGDRAPDSAGPVGSRQPATG